MAGKWVRQAPEFQTRASTASPSWLEKKTCEVREIESLREHWHGVVGELDFEAEGSTMHAHHTFAREKRYIQSLN